MTGGSGTAKTSTALLFFDTVMEQDNMRLKKICFSSATSPAMFQVSACIVRTCYSAFPGTIASYCSLVPRPVML